MEDIFLIRQVMKRYREKKKDLHMVLLTWRRLMIKYQGMLCGGLWTNIKSPMKYVGLIKDMYNNVVTSVRTSDGDTDDFTISI